MDAKQILAAICSSTVVGSSCALSYAVNAELSRQAKLGISPTEIHSADSVPLFSTGYSEMQPIKQNYNQDGVSTEANFQNHADIVTG